MIDSVIAGTGDSRYLRTSLAADTTWEDALTMLRAGTFPIDLAGINAAGFTTVGTALTSATLLKAAVCTALGLGADATPSDAWEVIISRISGKQDAPSTAGTAGQVLGLDNSLNPVWVDQSGGGGGTTEVAWFTYGTSTSAEIEAAYQAGKVCACPREVDGTTRVFFLGARSSATSHTFGCVVAATAYQIKCDSDTWTNSSRGISQASTTNPEPLGTPSYGSGTTYARSNHVHAMPSASDVGAEPAVTEVTISTAGAVTQALDVSTIYHFTGALTALTVTATDPTTGKYQFDFLSGSTAPTLTVPASWVMPDNFMVEPNARYSLTVENGYCSLKKWSDSHSPFIYLDDDYGDFVINSNALTSSPNAFANVGSEVSSFSISGRLKNQLDANASLKLCDISAKAKALMGSTYVSALLSVGNGKVVSCTFNTWQSSSQVSIKNDTGAALAANTLVGGTIFILRTL